MPKAKLEIRVVVKKTTQKNHPFFLKSPLKKTIKPTKKHSLVFLRKTYEVKNKISITLVQLPVIFFQSNKTNSNEI